MHFFMYLRFPEIMLTNHLMFFHMVRQITAKVVDFNEESQKISLSMKALDAKEETEE